MSRQCRYCGAELPDNASFCPFCTGSQIEKEAVTIPVPKRKKGLILAFILVLAVIAALVAFHQLRPKTYDNGSAEIIYNNGGSNWHILLRNSIIDKFHWQTPQETFSRSCPTGTYGAVPLQLYVYDEATGSSVTEEFLELMDHSSVASRPRGGADPMECGDPAPNSGFSTAVLVSDIVFSTDCGTNDITWTIQMKNRDTVVLHEVVEILLSPELYYSWEDTPLETTEEVQDFLEKIKTELKDPGTIVNITLAPTVYEGDLKLTGRTVNLTGTVSGDRSTVMKGCITIDNREPLFATLKEIRFEGSGTGISGTEGFALGHCTFSGKDTGILCEDGSWPVLENCTFENCGTGWRFNSSSSTMQTAYYSSLIFQGNETGILLEKVPAADDLFFIDCVFEDNGQDIKNLAGNRISYTLETGQ